VALPNDGWGVVNDIEVNEVVGGAVYFEEGGKRQLFAVFRSGDTFVYHSDTMGSVEAIHAFDIEAVGQAGVHADPARLIETIDDPVVADRVARAIDSDDRSDFARSAECGRALTVPQEVAEQRSRGAHEEEDARH
jgi:hypothetical protein